MLTIQRNGKIRRWIMTGAGAFLVFALAFPVLAPRILDLESVRGSIQTRLADAIGGTVAFDRLDVALLPRPRVRVRSLHISVPGAFEGTAGSLSIHPKILPLFIGRLRASQITFEAPDLAVRFPAMPARGTQAERPGPLAVLKQSIADVGNRLASLAPSLAVVIRNGRVVLSSAEHPPVTVERLDARVILPPRGFSVQVACSASFWKDLAVDAQLDPQTLSAEGSLEVEAFRPHLLGPSFFPGGRSPFGDSTVDLDLSFRTDGVGYLRAQGSGAAPHLRLLRGGKTLHIERARFKGSLELDKRHTAIVIDDLEAASPRLAVQGELRHEAAGPGTGMTVTGRNIDIEALRHAVLFFATDLRPVQVVFSVLRAGFVPMITLESSGAATSGLVGLQQMRITATLMDGSVDIPGSPLQLTGVGGKAVIAGGVLQAEGLSARMGNTTGQQGTLRLGLQGGDAPFHLDMALQADLAELPPVLNAFIGNPAWTAELDRLRDIRGTARGRLVLGERLRSLSVTADVSTFELSASYQRVPFPLQVSGGRFLLKGRSISLEGVRGMLGKSSLNELTARLDLAGPARIEIASADASFGLNELYPWLSTLPTAARALNGIESVQGTVRLTVQRASIPLAEPRNAHFTAAGSVSGLTISGKDLPGAVIVSRGSFTADSGTFAFMNVTGGLADALLQASGRLDGYLRPAGAGTVTVTGSVGEHAVRWLGRTLRIPPELSVRTPLSLSPLRLSWQGRDALGVTGVIAFPKGPSVTLDVFRDPQAFTINALRIQDGNDRIDGSLRYKQRKLDISMSGTLREDTLTKVFANERLRHGRLSANFEARVPLDRPRESTARGTLEGERLPLPLLPGLPAPAVIDRIALRADGRTVTADAANLSIGGSHLAYTGTLAAAEDAYLVDGDLTVDRIDLDAFGAPPVKEQTADGDPRGPKRTQAPAGNLPLRGTVHFRAGSVAYGPLSAGPVRADITLGSTGIRAALTEAALCGLSLTGSAAVTGEETAFDLQAAAAGRELESTMTCLSRESIRSTGIFDLKVRLTARGQKQALVSALNGTVEFTAKNGRIHRAERLMRVLALLNVTELLRGKIPDPGKEGIAYNTVRLRGAVRNGTLQVSEAVLDGSVITISGTGAVDLPNRSVDAMFLVAPFKTFDAIINAIPGVRYIFGGNLIAVPVRLQGPLAEPTAEVMKPSDVGDQLVGLTTRVLKLPYKIVEPVIPGGRKEP